MVFHMLRPTRRHRRPDEHSLVRPRLGNPLQECFCPFGISTFGGWGSGARHILDCLIEEVRVFGPGETGPDEWAIQKDAAHQTEATLRRRLAWILPPSRTLQSKSTQSPGKGLAWAFFWIAALAAKASPRRRPQARGL